MEHSLGVTTFITWNPPMKSMEVGGIKLSAGNGVVLTTQTTNSSGRSFWPTIKAEYESLAPGELTKWVLFHAFVTDNPWTLPLYMGTIYGVVVSMDERGGSEVDYDDFLNLAYRTEGITQRMSYSELFDRFSSVTEKQTGMIKNLLLKLTPGTQWSHGEMANYSYWRIVIDFSIVDAIIGQQPFCNETHECSLCHKTNLQHYPISAKEWTESRILEIVGDEEKASQYMKVVWTVRQNIRHKTAHASAYPHERPYSELQHGDNEFDVDTIVATFENDAHALTGLENSMHEVTRILLLNDVLQTKIFPDLRPYLIRSGGMSWDEFVKLTEKKTEKEE